MKFEGASSFSIPLSFHEIFYETFIFYDYKENFNIWQRSKYCSSSVVCLLSLKVKATVTIVVKSALPVLNAFPYQEEV